jgi:hypothetical protein
MKTIKIILILLILASCKNKNEFIKANIIKTEIDKLNSKIEIENFIQKSDTNYKKYELKNLQDFNRDNRNDSVNKILANKLGVKTNFTKVDIDNNGYTDLLAIGDNHTCFGEGEKSCSFSPIVLMSFGKNKVEIINILKEMNSSIVPVIEYENSQPFLVIYNQKLEDWKKKIYKETKTKLTYKFGDFIEYNKNPKKIKISKIEFSTSGCFGTCPVYKLKLNRDSISIFNAQYYNFSQDRKVTYGKEEGVFYTKINETEFNKVEDLLNYCDFQKLNKEYYVNWTCDQSGDLKITYDNGKVKVISDYGLIGTFGLKTLYQKLSEFRFNEKWRKK